MWSAIPAVLSCYHLSKVAAEVLSKPAEPGVSIHSGTQVAIVGNLLEELVRPAQHQDVTNAHFVLQKWSQTVEYL